MHAKIIWSERDITWKAQSHDALPLQAQSAFLNVSEVQATSSVSNKLSTFEEAPDTSDIFWFFISGPLGIL